MEEYNKQYKVICDKAEYAINNGNNVIICGPENSGKTYLRDSLKELLKKQNYNIYTGIYDFKQVNRINGRTFVDEKFWIEEITKNKLSDILNQYEYIETNIQFPLK